jgi:ribonuclease BN (tRNA processing enzyme)
MGNTVCEPVSTSLSVTAVGWWAHTFAGPTTSFLVSAGNSSLLLDVGANPIQRMRELGIFPPSVNCVYISHMHSDHVGGFANFVFTRQLLGRKAENVPTLHVLAVGSILQDVQKLLTLQYPERRFDLEWVSLESMVEMSIDGIGAITAVPNSHSIPCFGVRVVTGNSVIGFTSDTAPTSEHREAYAGCSLLIGECFDLAEIGGSSLHARGHSSAEDLADLIAATQCPVVIPFHFDEKYQSEENRNHLLDRCNPTGATMIVDPVVNPVCVIG